MVMLLSRLSCPANDVPDACGVRRVKSPMVREIVGRPSSAERGTVVAAPVRVELTAAFVAVTVTSVSVTAARVRLRGTSVLVPRLRKTLPTERRS